MRTDAQTAHITHAGLKALLGTGLELFEAHQRHAEHLAAGTN